MIHTDSAGTRVAFLFTQQQLNSAKSLFANSVANSVAPHAHVVKISIL